MSQYVIGKHIDFGGKEHYTWPDAMDDRNIAKIPFILRSTSQKSKFGGLSCKGGR